MVTSLPSAVWKEKTSWIPARTVLLLPVPSTLFNSEKFWGVTSWAHDESHTCVLPTRADTRVTLAVLMAHLSLAMSTASWGLRT
ncbi:MAG: hypothetical protein J5674_02780 [Candidatus Methanomethylophilaceae archaeon]|nr:hypothetical protein [Candidatus Methanomethylophilaceae archaeon]